MTTTVLPLSTNRWSTSTSWWTSAVCNPVVVIEHNLDVIKTADYIIDLGPEGGAGGGTIVCTGTPEEVAACEASYTGKYLKRML